MLCSNAPVPDFLLISKSHFLISVFTFTNVEAESTVQLNSDGTLVWRMECFEYETSKYQIGYNHAVYFLENTSKKANPETEAKAVWPIARFNLFSKKGNFHLRRKK